MKMILQIATQLFASVALLGVVVTQVACTGADKEDAALAILVNGSGSVVNYPEVCQSDTNPDDCGKIYRKVPVKKGKVISLQAIASARPHTVSKWTIERTEINTELFSGGTLQDWRDKKKLERKYGDYRGYVSRTSDGWEPVGECYSANCEITLKGGYEYRAVVDFTGYCLGDALTESDTRLPASAGPWAAAANGAARIHEAIDQFGVDFVNDAYGLELNSNDTDFKAIRDALGAAASQTFAVDGTSCTDDLATIIPILETFTGQFNATTVPSEYVDIDGENVEVAAEAVEEPLEAFYRGVDSPWGVGAGSKIYMNSTSFDESADELMTECIMAHELGHHLAHHFFSPGEKLPEGEKVDSWVCGEGPVAEPPVGDDNSTSNEHRSIAEAYEHVTVQLYLAPDVVGGKLRTPVHTGTIETLTWARAHVAHVVHRRNGYFYWRLGMLYDLPTMAEAGKNAALYGTKTKIYGYNDANWRFIVSSYNRWNEPVPLWMRIRRINHILKWGGSDQPQYDEWKERACAGDHADHSMPHPEL